MPPTRPDPTRPAPPPPRTTARRAVHGLLCRPTLPEQPLMCEGDSRRANSRSGGSLLGWGSAFNYKQHARRTAGAAAAAGAAAHTRTRARAHCLACVLQISARCCFALFAATPFLPLPARRMASRSGRTPEHFKAWNKGALWTRRPEKFQTPRVDLQQLSTR